MSVFPAYMLYVCLVFMEVIRGPSGTVVKDGCKLLFGSWDLNLGYLQEQEVLSPAPKYYLDFVKDNIKYFKFESNYFNKGKLSCF